MVTYRPLWKTLIDKGMTKTQLREKCGCSTSTLARLGKDEYVGLDLISKICYALDCKIEDVVEIVPQKDVTLL